MLEVMRVEEPPVWNVGEEEIGIVCPNCKTDESECLHQRLKSYRGRAAVYKCWSCKEYFTDLLESLLKDAPTPCRDKRAKG